MLEQETNGTSTLSNLNSSEAAPDQPKSDVFADGGDNAGSNAEESGENNRDEEEEEKPNGNSSKDNIGDYFAVFVKSIPFTATEDDVRKHFEKTCKVKKVTLVMEAGRCIGRGTVELEDKDSYQEAKKMIGSLMDGRPLYVVPHRLMKPAENAEQTDKKIYKAIVRNIPASMTVLDAKRHFYSAGLIKDFVVKKKGASGMRNSTEHDGTAILKVDSLDTFIKLMRMDKTNLGGEQIRVEPWGGVEVVRKKSSKRSSGGINQENAQKRIKNMEEIRRMQVETSMTLFVGNLPYIVSREEIMDHFEQVGPVVDCKIPLTSNIKIRRPVAFVTMADKASYEKGLKLLGSTINDCEIHVGAVKDVNWRSKWTFIDKPPGKRKENFVAFVANIPYPCTEESIRRHFADVGEILHVDIPVRSGVQRGVAYVTLGNQAAFEKALDMHHTTLDGRVIDVLNASHGDKPYDLPPKLKRQRYYRPKKRGSKLTWDSLCY